MFPRVWVAAYELLKARNLSCRDLAKLAHCHHRHAARTLEKMREQGLVHVAAWERCQGQARAVYGFGPGADAPKPAPLTNQEKKTRMAAKVSVEVRDFAAARRRQLRRKVKVDPLTAAFFGVKR